MSDKLKSIQLVDRLDGAPRVAPGRRWRSERAPGPRDADAGSARQREEDGSPARRDSPAGARRHG